MHCQRVDGIGRNRLLPKWALLIIGQESYMRIFRLGDHLEGAALCSDIFDAITQWVAWISFITALVFIGWEHATQRYSPNRTKLYGCSLGGLVVDFLFALSLYFLQRGVVFGWRSFQSMWSNPLFSW